MSEYSFNWRWSSATKTRANRLKAAPVSLSARTFSLRGPNDATKFKAFHQEAQNDVVALSSLVNSNILPVVDSLPAGGADTRWRLRKEIDCFSYGIQGTTLFVFNTASSSVADGRYWNTTEGRPYTIAEKLEQHEGRLSSLESSPAVEVLVGNTGLQAIWRAIGLNYQDGAKESWSYSLDSRVGQLECHDNQLAPDLYGDGRSVSGGYVNPSNAIEKFEGYNDISGDPGWSDWSWSSNCVGHNTYGALEYVHYLALLHGVNLSAGERPWLVEHEDADAISLPLTQEPAHIRSSTTYQATRTTPFADSLKYDLGRLRYELASVRGTGWADGVQTGPFITNWPAVGNSEQSLYLHVNYVGSGHASTTNPHGLTYVDTGASTLFVATRTFVGMDGIGDSTPDYSTHVGVLKHITDGDSLELAIAKLDQVTPTTIARYEQYASRALDGDGNPYTDEQREVIPIVINHNLRHHPIINVIDVSPEEDTPYAGSWTRDINIEYVDLNTFYVYTGAEDVLIIWIG